MYQVITDTPHILANTAIATYYIDYEEKVINGVLHWRLSKDSNWIRKTLEELTALLLEARRSGYFPQPYHAGDFPLMYYAGDFPQSYITGDSYPNLESLN